MRFLISTLVLFLVPVFAFAAGADLSIGSSNISFSDDLIAGTQVRIYSQVTNVGDEDVAGYVSFFQGSLPIGDSQVISVRSGGVPEEVYVDFVVPSRMHPGKVYVLPQAPQQFKQLLMVGGVDKYYQIAPCARDEDPRADRHYGVFYQVDMEMSFPTQEALFETAENLIKATYTAVAPEKEIVEFPFPRIPFN